VIDLQDIRLLYSIHRNTEMRFTEIRNETALSDATLSRRLNKLIDRGLLTLKAHREVGGRNYFTYILTDKGEKVLRELDPGDILQRFDRVKAILT